MPLMLVKRRRNRTLTAQAQGSPFEPVWNGHLNHHERVTSLMVAELALPDWLDRVALRLSSQGSMPPPLDQHERHTTAKSDPHGLERAARRPKTRAPELLTEP